MKMKEVYTRKKPPVWQSQQQLQEQESGGPPPQPKLDISAIASIFGGASKSRPTTPDRAGVGASPRTDTSQNSPRYEGVRLPAVPSSPMEGLKLPLAPPSPIVLKPGSQPSPREAVKLPPIPPSPRRGSTKVDNMPKLVVQPTPKAEGRLSASNLRPKGAPFSNDLKDIPLPALPIPNAAPRRRNTPSMAMPKPPSLPTPATTEVPRPPTPAEELTSVVKSCPLSDDISFDDPASAPVNNKEREVISSQDSDAKEINDIKSNATDTGVSEVDAPKPRSTKFPLFEDQVFNAEKARKNVDSPQFAHDTHENNTKKVEPPNNPTPTGKPVIPAKYALFDDVDFDVSISKTDANIPTTNFTSRMSLETILSNVDFDDTEDNITHQETPEKPLAKPASSSSSDTDSKFDTDSEPIFGRDADGIKDSESVARITVETSDAKIAHLYSDINFDDEPEEVINDIPEVPSNNTHTKIRRLYTDVNFDDDPEPELDLEVAPKDAKNTPEHHKDLCTLSEAEDSDSNRKLDLGNKMNAANDSFEPTNKRPISQVDTSPDALPKFVRFNLKKDGDADSPKDTSSDETVSHSDGSEREPTRRRSRPSSAGSTLDETSLTGSESELSPLEVNTSLSKVSVVHTRRTKESRGALNKPNITPHNQSQEPQENSTSQPVCLTNEQHEL